MIVRSSEIHCKEKLSEILNGFDSCDQDRTFYILSALHRILPDDDFDIHVWRDDGYYHLDYGEMMVTKAEDLLHNGFEVDISHCIRFAPCGFHIDNPNNRFVFC